MAVNMLIFSIIIFQFLPALSHILSLKWIYWTFKQFSYIYLLLQLVHENFHGPFCKKMLN